MSGKLSFKAGGVRVELDDIGEDLIRRTLDNVAPELVDNLHGAASRVASHAQARWPVGAERGRSHSRDTFQASVEIEQRSPRAFRAKGRVTNSAPYWFLVRPLELWPSNAVQVHVRAPMAEERDDLIGRLGSIVGKGLKRGK